LAWESDAGEYIAYLRSIQTHAAEAETADHQRLTDLTDKLRTGSLKTYFAFSSDQAMKSYEHDLQRYEESLAASESENDQKRKAAAAGIQAGSTALGIVAFLAGLIWAGSHIINFVIGFFSDPPIPGRAPTSAL
jgi:hypothetical protein